MTPDRLPDPLAVALEVARLLEQLEIPYLAAGSLASSLHGEPRSTNDVDFVVDLMPDRVPGFLTALGDRYYVSAEAVTDAVRAGGVFNLIHFATAVKVDLFVAGDDAFDAERLATRRREAAVIHASRGLAGRRSLPGGAASCPEHANGRPTRWSGRPTLHGRASWAVAVPRGHERSPSGSLHPHEPARPLVRARYARLWNPGPTGSVCRRAPGKPRGFLGAPKTIAPTP